MGPQTGDQDGGALILLGDITHTEFARRVPLLKIRDSFETVASRRSLPEATNDQIKTMLADRQPKGRSL